MLQTGSKLQLCVGGGWGMVKNIKPLPPLTKCGYLSLAVLNGVNNMFDATILSTVCINSYNILIDTSIFSLLYLTLVFEVIDAYSTLALSLVIHVGSYHSVIIVIRSLRSQTTHNQTNSVDKLFI